MPPASPPASPEPVHKGFFLRLHLGGGVNSYSSGGGSTQLSGSGVSLGIALGGAITPNLAFYGNFFESVIGDISVKTTRTDLAKTGNGAVGGFGAGAIYYIEPINLYVSGTIGLAVVIIQDAKGNMIDSTDNGVAFQAMIGKEWWVSPHWGVGPAVEIVAATAMKDQNDPSVSWTAEAFNVVLSATYF